MSVNYHHGKANLLTYDLKNLFMGRVAHVEEERKELSKDVHKLSCLGVRIMSISMVVYQFRIGQNLLW